MPPLPLATRIPRENIVAMLVYIRDNKEVSTSELCRPLSRLENKLYNSYPNELLRALAHFLVKRGFVAGEKTHIGGGEFFFRNLRVTNKGLHYIDRRWYLALAWDELKDIFARIVAATFKPN